MNKNSRVEAPVDELPSRQDSPWLLYTARQRWGYLAILFFVSTSNFMDRYVVSVLLEPIKLEFQVSDTMLGLLSGFTFAFFYAVAGIPVARWADRGNRRTVITVALTVWSTMTLLCGMAQSFWQLLLARVGVGAGESGGVPPSHSLIVDYFPPQRRAMALAIFMAASSLGYIVGVGGGGYVADAYGWRSAFLLLGLPGLLLALLVRFTLAEPRLQLGFRTPTAAENIRETFSTLWRKRSFRYAVTGISLYGFVIYSLLTFVPSFLMRVLRIPLAEASGALAIVGMASTLVGTLGGGALGDRMGQRDVRWLAWLPAAACLASAPLHLLAFNAHDLRTFLVFYGTAQAAVSAGIPAIFTALFTICGSRRRAMASAILLFAATLFGSGMGPLASGALSDALSAAHGVDGLRYALMAATAVLFFAGSVFYLFGRAMPIDQET